MAYTKKIWKDYPDTTTPILASDMNNIEDGLETVDTVLTGKQDTMTKAVGADVIAGTDDTKYVTSKAIKDASVNLEAWTAYTPTTTNLTEGNGTLTAAYCRIGKTIHFYINFVLGSTSAIGTTPAFALPVPAKTANIEANVILLDANVGLYSGGLEPTTGNVVPKAIGVSGNYTNVLGITATVPFIWTTNDYIKISGTYEAA